MTTQPMDPEDPELREALRAMAAEDAGLTPPPRVEEALMRAWDTQAQAPASAGGAQRVMWTVLALAASLVIAAVLRDRWTPPGPNPSSSRSDRDIGLRGPGDGITDVSYGAMSWLDTDPASLQIIRLRVPSATLAAQGYAVSDPDGDGSVEIDMIIGADGAARSVRLNATWP